MLGRDQVAQPRSQRTRLLPQIEVHPDVPPET